MSFFQWFLQFNLFLSTPSARRATQQQRQTNRNKWISIHALREEGDRMFLAFCAVSYYFYPRPPRGGRQSLLATASFCCSISIHALREEGDTMAYHSVSNFRISIHALREEGDLSLLDSATSVYLFLSTPSARRATIEGA